jgi:predicted RNase H-like HicB family nuclease
LKDVISHDYFKKSGDYWVVLCLENGVVSQGSTKEEALIKMREAAWH